MSILFYNRYASSTTIGEFVYINILRPTQKQPTPNQQRARAASLREKKRSQVRLIYANWAHRDNIERTTVRRPIVRTTIEKTALNVTYKLLNVAFSNYANGHETVASRPIPPRQVIGEMSHDAFTALVREYAKRYVWQRSKLSVTHEDGYITLRVDTKEPKVSVSSSKDKLYVTI